MKNGGNPHEADHSKFPFFPTPVLPGSGSMGLISARNLGHPYSENLTQNYKMHP